MLDVVAELPYTILIFTICFLSALFWLDDFYYVFQFIYDSYVSHAVIISTVFFTSVFLFFMSDWFFFIFSSFLLKFSLCSSICSQVYYCLITISLCCLSGKLFSFISLDFFSRGFLLFCFKQILLSSSLCLTFLCVYEIRWNSCLSLSWRYVLGIPRQSVCATSSGWRAGSGQEALCLLLGYLGRGGAGDGGVKSQT